MVASNFSTLVRLSRRYGQLPYGIRHGGALLLGLLVGVLGTLGLLTHLPDSVLGLLSQLVTSSYSWINANVAILTLAVAFLTLLWKIVRSKREEVGAPSERPFPFELTSIDDLPAKVGVLAAVEGGMLEKYIQRQVVFDALGPHGLPPRRLAKPT